MIFAAGLGTRLRPLTNNKPKALVEVKGKPLLEYCIRRLKFFGCTDIIVNIHHFGKQIISFLEKNNNFGINISISDERDLLLNTGGGLKKAASFFGESEDFLVVNVDILHNIGSTSEPFIETYFSYYNKTACKCSHYYYDENYICMWHTKDNL